MLGPAWTAHADLPSLSYAHLVGDSARPARRGTRARAERRACRIRASARVEAEVGDEPGLLSQRNGSRSRPAGIGRCCSRIAKRNREPGSSGVHAAWATVAG